MAVLNLELLENWHVCISLQIFQMIIILASNILKAQLFTTICLASFSRRVDLCAPNATLDPDTSSCPELVLLCIVLARIRLALRLPHNCCGLQHLPAPPEAEESDENHCMLPHDFNRALGNIRSRRPMQTPRAIF
ncbi:hypothetical protein AAFF_G00224060 [Aldrovandia affinis]|uniref:Uncharacterized protein n=1 Tax=Aldrovandia affinis TaxID=143900 RepID=A0AAD7TB77_9TELE|nr:hypothetical protein AAFF_G00224060 [Aldrovandia affinis]